jgi:hypothetical protein
LWKKSEETAEEGMGRKKDDQPRRKLRKEQGVSGIIRKACFPITQTSSPKNLVLLMSYLGNASL